MVKREEIQGRWNEVKGRLKEHWGQLTDDELQQAKGSTDRLVGVVQEKTGATRSEVERFLDNMFGESVTDQLGETAQQYSEAAQQLASEAAEYARDRYRRVASQTGNYTEQLAESVRARPGESMAIAFGLGIAAGALLFLGGKRR
ncbi:CsbD family protein [Roseiconus nitratireducens]|uniref:CsbD family protein n=1 Tax=Roseiconus nitratireducens TaxID=2605748 RepID=A0A5M6D8J3_9BACT|nr:CsbD family protein [Roseiconus nitratireducens]KAA5542632.1 CsbD family protein [Roseiconus nitratireducens]